MIRREGPGFLINTAVDQPWQGWLDSRWLEDSSPPPIAAWNALRRVAMACGQTGDGLALIWTQAPEWFERLGVETRRAFLETLSGLPKLDLHWGESLPHELPDGAFRGWLHQSRPPADRVSELWRQGVLGWVPDSPGHWSMPHFGRVPALESELLPPEEILPVGWLWGELVLALPALPNLVQEASLRQMVQAVSETQAHLEKAMAHRMMGNAWPSTLSFHRRQVGWRIALTGGAEFQRSVGHWDEAASWCRTIHQELQRVLKGPCFLGASEDFQSGAWLGRQAMREGLPWRQCLPLPPHPPSFTPGLGADPRQASALEARAWLPAAFQPLLDHKPGILLRVPAVPRDSAVQAFVARLDASLPLRWLPPELPVPGPFTGEEGWAPAAAYPMPPDPDSALQPMLFDWTE